MSDIFDLLREKVEAAGLLPNKLATLVEINHFEERFAVRIPTDLREYFLRLNGTTAPIDMCHFWALNEITRFTDFFPLSQPFNPIHAFSSVDGLPLPDAESFFIFGDYGFKAGFWAINLYAPLEAKNSIVIAYSSQVYNYLPLQNFTEFMEGFLQDPHVLLI